MGGEWKETTLGAITEWSSGGTPPKDNGSYWGGAIPWISASSMKTMFLCDSDLKITDEGLKNGSRLAPMDSVLVLVRGSELHKRIPVGIATRPVAFNQDVKALQARTEILPRYLFYWLAGNAQMLLGKVEHTGIGAGKLATDVLKGLDVHLPPLNKQHAIADILGSLDDKIELNRRTNETLEAMARAIFKSWFIDFDPVVAKSEGRQPDGMDAETAKLFPSSFEDSEIGRVPKGWKVQHASELAEVGIGKTPPRNEHQWFSTVPSDIPWMSIRDLGNASAFISRTNELLTSAAVEKFRIRRIPDNTVVLSFKLTIGRVAVTDGEMLSNEAIAHFLLKPSTPFGSSYLYCYLKGFSYDELGSTSSIATAINSDMVRHIKVLVPPKDIASVFEELVFPLFSTIKTLCRQSSAIAVIRETLLPRLMSGEVQVAELAREAV